MINRETIKKKANVEDKEYGTHLLTKLGYKNVTCTRIYNSTNIPNSVAIAWMTDNGNEYIDNFMIDELIHQYV